MPCHARKSTRVCHHRLACLIKHKQDQSRVVICTATRALNVHVLLAVTNYCGALQPNSLCILSSLLTPRAGAQCHRETAKYEIACTYIHDFLCAAFRGVVCCSHSQLATDSDRGRFVLADATTHTAHHNHNT